MLGLLNALASPARERRICFGRSSVRFQITQSEEPILRLLSLRVKPPKGHGKKLFFEHVLDRAKLPKF